MAVDVAVRVPAVRLPIEATDAKRFCTYSVSALRKEAKRPCVVLVPVFVVEAESKVTTT